MLTIPDTMNMSMGTEGGMITISRKGMRNMDLLGTSKQR